MTTGFAGLDFVLKVGDSQSPEIYTTLSAMRETSCSLNFSPIEITNKGSAFARELLDGAGVKSMQITAAGVFEDSTVYETLRGYKDAQTIKNYDMVLPNGDVIRGRYKVTGLQLTGNHDDAFAYSLTLESSNSFTYHRLLAPSAVTGASLALWLDPTSGVTTSGGAVSAWLDRSAEANNAVGVGSNQPAHSLTSLNGRAGMTYDSTDFLTVTDDASIAFASAFEGFVVFQRDSDAGAAQGILNKDGGAGSREWLLAITSADVLAMTASTDGTAQATATGATTIAVGTPYLARFGWDGTNIFHSLNNGTASTAALASLNDSATDLLIGRTTGAPLLGKIGSVVLFNTATPLTTVQRTGVYNYLAYQHGLALI